MTMKSFLLNSNRSVPNLCHGLEGGGAALSGACD